MGQWSGDPRRARSRRVAAFLADSLIIGLYAGGLAVVSIFFFDAGGGGRWDMAFSHPIGGHLLRLATLTGPVAMSLALFEASGRAATPGKQLFGLQVTSVTGGQISLRRAISRNALKFLPWELSHVAIHHMPGWPAKIEGVSFVVVLVMLLGWILGGLYLVLTLIDPHKGPLYDRILDTRVVGRRARSRRHGLEDRDSAGIRG